MLKPVANLSDIPDGGSKSVRVGEREIALFNVAGRLYALDDECPHQGGSLTEGKLRGEMVYCPLHMWSFDVTNGLAPLHPECQATCHAVRVDGNHIYLELSHDAGN